MWFVTNKTNCIKLKKFEKKVIIPLFTELLMQIPAHLSTVSDKN